jgi:hypothetical protein
MAASFLQPGLSQGAVERAGRQVVARLPRYRNAARPGGVLELSVAASARHAIAADFAQQLEDLADLHTGKDTRRPRPCKGRLDYPGSGDAGDPLLKAYGILGFRGIVGEAEYLALHPDLLAEEGR